MLCIFSSALWCRNLDIEQVIKESNWGIEIWIYSIYIFHRRKKSNVTVLERQNEKKPMKYKEKASDMFWQH